MRKLIEFRNIVKNFDGQIVLKGVNLNIYENEFVTLLGPSGCGKTTLLRILGGFLEQDEGTVIFDGQCIDNVPAYKREINTVFQRYALFPHLNVFENIAFGLRIKKLGNDIIAQKVNRMLSLVNLEGYEKRNVTKLSGGQQQRVAIARAVVKMPRVLLLDEPLSNLDARLRLQTREEIRRIQRDTGITTVFVTHDQEEAMSISDMIVVMKDGVVQQIGRPQDVYDSPVNLFVSKFLGTPPINVFGGVVKGGRLFIGDESVLDVPGASDGEVWAGIRPEGFIPDASGPLTCKLRGVEVMGRDISVVCAHDKCEATQIRAIISAENAIDEDSPTVRFSLKPRKVHLFDRATEARIRFDTGEKGAARHGR